MTFSGTQSLVQTDEAARKLGATAASSADIADSISSVAELIGCGEFAAKCLEEAAEAVSLCRSLAELLERKREELYLASIGLHSTAASMASVTEAMALELQSSMANDAAADDDEYDAARVATLVQQLESTDPDDTDSIDSLTAELQIELERKTGDYDAANLAAELVKGGANVDDALAYVATTDDFVTVRLTAVGKARNPEALIQAIIPTLDLTNRVDINFAMHLVQQLTFGKVDLELAELTLMGNPTLAMEELRQISRWLDTYDNTLTHELIEALRGGVRLNAQPYLDDLLSGVTAGLSEGGNVDDAILALLWYAERDEKTGEVVFDEELLTIMGLDVATAQSMYVEALQVELLEFDDFPDRPSVLAILVDYGISQGMSPEQANSWATDVQSGVSGLTENYGLLSELTKMYYPGAKQDDSLTATDLKIFQAAFDGDGVPMDPMTEWQVNNNARREGVSREVYLDRLRADIEERIVFQEGSVEEFEAMVRNINAHQPDVFRIIGAGQQGTALLKLETADDFAKLGGTGEIDSSTVEAFRLGLYGRSYLGLDDIDEIDKVITKKIDHTLSLDDLSEWLVGSGLPIAVQDVLLGAANYGGIDTGFTDRLLNWSGKISLAITAIGAASMLLAPPVGAAIMTAGGILGGVTAAGVAVYRGDWIDAATESIWLTLDLLDGPTQIASVGAVMRARRLRELQHIYPDMMKELADEFSDEYVDDLIKGASNGLDFSKYAAVVANSDNLSPEKLAALRLFGTDLVTADGVRFKLSDEGFKALKNGQRAEIERLASNWKDLSADEAWQLYQWTTYKPTISKTDFKAAIVNDGKAFDPTVKQLKFPYPKYDTTGWRLKGSLTKAGDVKPADGYEAHHIVAINDRRAEKSRQLLGEYGIDINDAHNGAWLPQNADAAKAAGLPAGVPHGDLHTDEYYRKIDQRLKNARSDAVAKYGADDAEAIKNALELELDEIAADLVAGETP